MGAGNGPLRLRTVRHQLDQLLLRVRVRAGARLRVRVRVRVRVS